MKSNEPLLQIGDLVKASGKTARAIHLYEEMGLIKPVARSEGGFRLYHEDSIERLAWISKLQELGFTLPAIQDFLQSITTKRIAKEAMDQVRQAFAAKLAETRTHLARLQELEKDLQASLN